MNASNDWRVGRFKRPARLSLALTLALGSAIAPGAASAAPPQLFDAATPGRAETLDGFYAARGYRPLWLTEEPGSWDVPRLLIDMLRSADADGLDPETYRTQSLELAVSIAGYGDPEAIQRADRMLSEAFVAYVRDLRRLPGGDMIWVDPELRPANRSTRRLLEDAASASSLDRYLGQMQWMSPLYVGLRQAIVTGAAGSRAEYDLLRLNLDRARSLPAAKGRYILVNASAAQLTMYQDGGPVDSMRVVVGKQVHPTPMMAALIRFTSLNPYWNVPPDLAAERVAPNVIKSGVSYLKTKGYQVLASWEPDAAVIDPATIDWPAVAAGRQEVRLRQLPGPANAMGKMKFMFPNAQGIYLHDTPDKNLLGEETRMFSGGCVRLEDAPRLARWLYNGTPPSTSSTHAEQRVDLPRPVPVFLTYLTAVPGETGVTFLPDVYGRDRAALAALYQEPKVASR